jgi:HK97 family phage portal protein
MSRRNRARRMSTSDKSDPGIAYVVSQQGVAAPAMMPRNMRAYIQEGYRSNKTVFRVVGHIARAGAGIKWKHYTDESKKREMPNSELLQLWNNPSPRVSGTAFREAMIAYYCLTGNNYLLGINANMNPNGKFDELYNLRPDLTKIKVDNDGPLYYEFGNFSPPRRYANPFVMHNKLFAANDDVYGMSPVEVAAMLVDIQKAGQKWNLGLLSNMARPGGAWVTDALLGDTEYKSLKEEIRKKFAGPRNAGETAILHGGVKWQSMSMSPYELDWLESDTKGDRDIAGIFFNFPLFLLGLADSTYSNQEEARYALYTEIDFPILDMFQDSLNMWLTPRYGGYLSYDQEDVEAIQTRMQEAKGQASDRAMVEFTGGTTTFLEAREIQGRPKIAVKDFVIINQIPVHVDDLDDYIAAMSGKVINPPPPPPMLPPPDQTTVTEVPNDTQDNPTDNTPPQKSLDAVKLAQWQIEQRQEVNNRLANYNDRQVTHLRWIVDGKPCEECQQNANEVVAVGDAFPSGAELPPVHPNCQCQVTEMSTAQFGMAGQDVQLDRKEDEDETSEALKKYTSALPQLAVTREQYRELLRAKR